MSDYEHDRALMEAAQNSSAEGYFLARSPALNIFDNHVLFEDGFERGWKARADLVPQAAPAPEGWKLVPIDPPWELIEAAFAGRVEVQCVTTQMRARAYMKECYQKMIAAAPTQKEPTK